MLATANPEINVEDLMRRIRQEVAQRKAQLPSAPPAPTSPATIASLPPEVAMPWARYAQTIVALPRLPESTGCVASKPEYTLAELLNYEDDCFIRSAYLAILRREPDASGQAHYLHLLRTGQLSKAEILGRLRYSPEGKTCAVPVHGLLLPFVVQSAYRIPVLGYGVALANYLLRLPVIIRNRVGFEANSVRQQRVQLAQINVLVAQIEMVIGQVQQSCDKCNTQFGQSMQNLETLAQKAAVAQVEALATQTGEQILGLNKAVETKAPNAQVEAIAAQTKALAAQTGEQILGLNKAVETKAPKAQVEAIAAQTKALAAQTDDQILSLTQEVETKAAVAQVEALATQTGEQIFSLSKALEVKADNERLTQLTNHLVELVQRKADAAELAAAATRLGEELAQKAAVAQVDALAAQTGEQILGLSQVVDTKAAATQLEALATQTNEKVQELAQALQTKANADELAGTATRLGEALAQKADAATTQQETQELQRQILDHKHNILDQHRRLALLLEEARKRLPAPISTEQIENMVAEEDHLLDAFYVSFEDRFRGTREDIKQRVAVYLPVIQEAKAGTQKAPVLDIGCGRGEWLQLLSENNLVGRGVDLNRVMVSQCQELGLEVAEADAIAYLRKLKANSLGAVTGMHIIEHIPFKRLIALFDEVLRVLKPGGVAIFETPNPENLIVGACNFYYDPTHLNPLPPEPMKFVMEARGFGRIEILRLHPQPETAMLREGAAPVQQLLNSLFCGAQDYSLVAYKN